jgi:hypothetical protein
MKTETKTRIKLTASEGEWFYDGVTEPVKSALLAVDADTSDYRKISEDEYHKIMTELEDSIRGGAHAY